VLLAAFAGEFGATEVPVSVRGVTAACITSS
jgi:hypothetical protein